MKHLCISYYLLQVQSSKKSETLHFYSINKIRVFLTAFKDFLFRFKWFWLKNFSSVFDKKLRIEMQPLIRASYKPQILLAVDWRWPLHWVCLARVSICTGFKDNDPDWRWPLHNRWPLLEAPLLFFPFFYQLFGCHMVNFGSLLRDNFWHEGHQKIRAKCLVEFEPGTFDLTVFTH